MDEYGQTALEYLLMLAGAISVAVGVGLWLKSIPAVIGVELNEAKSETINNIQ